MEEQLFNELCAGIEEADAHLRGELDLPAGRIHFPQAPDPRALRARFELTQEEFAARLEIPVSTLRNWEQGRRRPDPAAVKLLKIIARHPDLLFEEGA